MPTFQRLTSHVKAAWKWLTSTGKSDWTLEDYPVETWFNSPSVSSQASRWKPLPWNAAVINWSGMSGAGNTRREALADLHKNFQKFKSTNPNLPRPGSKSKVPVVFAATTRVDRHTELAKDFIKRVLGIEWAWISDESSLDDFHTEETNSALIEKIRSNYGVDVSDIGNGNLADILDRIAEKAHSVPN